MSSKLNFSQILRNQADAAAADLTNMGARSKFVSFTTPFMNLELGFVYKKPTVKFDIYAFLMPFSGTIWIVIATSLTLTVILLYAMEKCCAKDETLGDFISCWYFGFACFLAQGPDTYPRRMSSRVLSISWWFFSLMVLSLYTANLTSILTVNRSAYVMEDFEDLLTSHEFNYGTTTGGALEETFRNSNSASFQLMWNKMLKTKDISFYSNFRAGIEKARATDNFAFIYESPHLEYVTSFAPCNLQYVVSYNSPKTGWGLYCLLTKLH